MSTIPANRWNGNRLDFTRYGNVPRLSFPTKKEPSLLDDEREDGADSLLDMGGMGGLGDRDAPGRGGQSRDGASPDWGSLGTAALGLGGALVGGPLGALASLAGTGISATRDKANADSIASRMGTTPNFGLGIEGTFANTFIGSGLGAHSYSRQAADQAYDTQKAAALAPDAPGVEAFGGKGNSNPEGEGIFGRDQEKAQAREQPSMVERTLAELSALLASSGGAGLGGISAGAGGTRGNVDGLGHMGYGALGSPSSYGFSDLSSNAGPSAAPSTPGLADLAASLANAGDMSFSGQESGGGGGGSMSGTAGDPGADGGPSGPWDKGGKLPRVSRDTVPGPDDQVITAKSDEIIIRPEVTQKPGVSEALLAINDGTIPGEALVSLLDFYSNKKPESLLAA